MRNFFISSAGAVIHLLVVSVPLLSKDVSLHHYLSRYDIITYFLLALLFFLSESYCSYYISDSKAQTKSDKPYLPYSIGVCLLITFWSLTYASIQTASFSLTRIYFACFFFIIGIIIRVKAIAALRSYFVSHIALIENHQLITTGIYSIIRHPSEFGVFMICIGGSILFTNIISISIMFIALFPLITYRIIQEEKLLQMHFPIEFAEYKSKTSRLLPLIW